MVTLGSANEEDGLVDKHEQVLAVPCGLYCGVCTDYVGTVCHGCGCACGACAGAAHVEQCLIAACVHERNLESCADCPDLPCTRLIQFANDPIWRTHAPVIEDLRRRRQIGTDAWLAEQAAYWGNAKYRQRWLALHAECAERHRATAE